MKFVAIMLVLALLASLVGVGYLYMTSRVVVEATGVTIVEAATDTALFQQLKQQVNDGGVVGTAFVEEMQGEAEDYVYVTCRLQLRNDCYVDAEMVEFQVTPQTTDILQIGASQPARLPARSTDVYEVKLLATMHSSAVREVTITYYVWGKPFTQKVTVRSSGYQTK